MIVSPNIVAKMFAKFAKTFDGLAVTIVVPERKMRDQVKYAKAQGKELKKLQQL